MSLDGAVCFEDRREGAALEAAAIGHAAGMTVRQKAGEDFLKAIALEQMG
ncbi:hypothetical protein JCM17844_12100 [Iodidimonas gelatinilytica]|uniref:Uncharacterized protein n=1 Tax=Iodidimonas gelatinilytica TaxID=1236966 RepID=A0A5A7MQT8_9PROT|nr:hypothetical protein JCM17844_12100 [Iodidimonas gelatinilytica]